MAINNKIKHSIGTGLVMGLSYANTGYEFTCELDVNDIKLLIYDKKHSLIDIVNMKDYSVNSSLASVLISGIASDFSYSYEKDGIAGSDIYGKNAILVDDKDNSEQKIENSLYIDDFDWGEDNKPNLSFNDIISYQLHVKGFTMHPSSKVSAVARGRFLGITEKIPYLNDLGINQIVLMPAYDFDNTDSDERIQTIYTSTESISKKATDDNKINYWGFKAGFYYRPKLSYSNKDSVNEFKAMVKKLHTAGIEVIMRFYFPDNVNHSIILDILRFWVADYHVDGFFLMGSDLPIKMIASDLYLRDTKIYVESGNIIDINRAYSFNKNIAFADNDFSLVMKKYLKSDENMLSDFLFRQRNNPINPHVINYITDYKGFTLNDLVSYDYKHNEANEENNNDGEDYNHSWNCGVEGPTKKKSVCDLRMKQMKNAIIMLLMASGTPMLLAGDEMMNSQEGNNNPYCQDNEIGWVKWNNNRKAKCFYEFTKSVIALRKRHPVLRPFNEFRIMDYAACGFPDLSYHGDNAWAPKLDNYLRHIGIMICGKYVRVDRVNEDDFFYIAYNMHWEDHQLALPKLPKDRKWIVILETNDKNDDSKYSLSDEEDYINVCNRSITVLKSIRN